MRLVLVSQFTENYGAHDWNGKGQCPQYWKMKGGTEYVYPLSTEDCVKLGANGIAKLACKLSEQFTHNSDYSCEYMIDWNIIGDDELTSDEKLAVEFPEYGSYTTKVLKDPMQLKLAETFGEDSPNWENSDIAFLCRN